MTSDHAIGLAIAAMGFICSVTVAGISSRKVCQVVLTTYLKLDIVSGISGAILGGILYPIALVTIGQFGAYYGEIISSTTGLSPVFSILFMASGSAALVVILMVTSISTIACLPILITKRLSEYGGGKAE